jgi:sulfhydrogenase subunit alpha
MRIVVTLGGNALLQRGESPEADAAGLITSARTVPPTSQGQASIEDDLRRFVAGRLDLDDQQLTRQCEQAIRNYDPCISCATHFLDLTVDRG